MIRLQHYVELCYLIVGVLLIVDVVRLARHPRDIPRVLTPGSVAFGLLMVAMAPVTLAWLGFRFLRDN